MSSGGTKMVAVNININIFIYGHIWGVFEVRSDSFCEDDW